MAPYYVHTTFYVLFYYYLSVFFTALGTACLCISWDPVRKRETGLGISNGGGSVQGTGSVGIESTKNSGGVSYSPPLYQLSYRRDTDQDTDNSAVKAWGRGAMGRERENLLYFQQ